MRKFIHKTMSMRDFAQSSVDLDLNFIFTTTRSASIQSEFEAFSTLKTNKERSEKMSTSVLVRLKTSGSQSRLEVARPIFLHLCFYSFKVI